MAMIFRTREYRDEQGQLTHEFMSIDDGIHWFEVFREDALKQRLKEENDSRNDSNTEGTEDRS